MTLALNSKGDLIAVVGPSGVGKDSVMAGSTRCDALSAFGAPRHHPRA